MKLQRVTDPEAKIFSFRGNYPLSEESDYGSVSRELHLLEGEGDGRRLEAGEGFCEFLFVCLFWREERARIV